jgi:HEAT repeat protein
MAHHKSMATKQKLFNNRVHKALAFLEDRFTRDGEIPPRLTNAYWANISRILADRPQALALAHRLISSPNPRERFLATNIFDSFCNPIQTGEKGTQAKIIRTLIALAKTEPNSSVLHAIAWALGRPYEKSCLPTLIKLGQHPNSWVRTAAAMNIGSAVSEIMSLTQLRAIIKMTIDPDVDVRNWSTFALGTHLDPSDRLSPAVRAALWVRIHDRHTETRAEAFRGLARHGDPRGIAPLKAWLESQNRRRQTIWIWEIEAAGIYADPAFFPVLSDITTWWDGTKEKLTWARARCNPDPVVRAKTSPILPQP